MSFIYAFLFKALIRSEFNSLIGFKSWSVLPAKFPRLTDEELEKFEVEAPGAPVCTARNYRVCFSRGWKKCSFNRHAASVFTTYVLQKWKAGRYHDQGIPKEYFTRENISSCLDAHMEYARERWRFFQKPNHNQRLMAELKQKAVNGRKATVGVSYSYFRHAYSSQLDIQLYVSRVKTCGRHSELYEHLLYLERMENVHMSADSSDEEEDTGRLVYRYTPPAWQSKDLRTFFESLDDLGRQDWLRPFGKRRSSGNPPRARVRSGKPADPLAVAPRGLPRNFYDETWLKGLKEWQLMELDVQDEEFDLSF